MSTPSTFLAPIDEPTGPYCQHCGWELERELCDQCDGEGLYGHDCGEDCCPCLDPEDNEPCDLCGGEGGWWVCENTECPGKK
jgi:hypothetical protein